MTGLSQLLQTGLSGLSAAAEGMQTVANNTANVATPGYNAQSIEQIERPGSADGSGIGTEVGSIRRAFDQFLFDQGVQAASASEAAQAVQSTAQSLSAIFPVASGGAGGLGSALDDFFSAASQLAQDPASGANRQVFLGQARALAASFRAVGGQISASLDSIDGQTEVSVQQINQLTQQIAQLNQTIAGQTNSVAGPPNSVLDQRDQLIQQLGQQLALTTLPGAGGTISVYSSGGAALVNGDVAYRLEAGMNEYGDGAPAITYGPTGQDLTASLAGGRLGGLLAARRQTVGAQDSVDALAVALTAAVNTRQSLGLDLNGNLGQPLFAAAGPTTYASRSNTGSGSVTATVAGPSGLVPGALILTKTAAGFEVSDTTTGQISVLGGGPTLTIDGLTLTVAGAVNTGDSFKIEPTPNAAQSLSTVIADPAAIAAASPYVATPGNNIGNVQASVGDAVSGAALPAGAVVIPASQFGQPISVQFTSASSFDILSSSNAVIASGTISATAGAQIAIAYPAAGPAGEFATISLSAGTAGTGDSFALRPGGPGSNGNIDGLAGLASQTLLSGQTLGNFYSALVANVGSRGQEAEAAAQAAQAVLTQTDNSRQSVSGVNLDQQAANLIGYQQAYQAGAKVIATAQALFQSLLNAV